MARADVGTDPRTNESERHASRQDSTDAASSSRLLFRLLVATILIYSFAFCFKAGERGFFPLDQSIEFDGGYRILSGQVPYKDFVIPVGPMVFVLQAFVFMLFGVNFTAFLFGAALVNLFATALSMVVLSILFPRNRWPTLIAGFLTATWFYPPYGTPNMEQTAFFFSMLGITTLLAAVCDPRRPPVVQALLCALAGACTVLGFLSKQNAGLVILPVYGLLLLTACLPRVRQLLIATAWFTAGALVSAAAFITWLVLWSDPALFQEHFFTIPSKLGMGRLAEGRTALLGHLLGGNGSFLPTAMLLSSAWGVITLSMIVVRRSQWQEWSKPALAAILCIYLQFFQNAFGITTGNQWQECMPFVGLIFGCATGLMMLILQRQADDRTSVSFTWRAAAYVLGGSIILTLISGSKVPVIAAGVLLLVARIVGLFREPSWRRVSSGAVDAPPLHNWRKRREQLALFTIFVVVGCGFQGIRAAWIRSVHDIFRGASFTEESPVAGLEHLKWGNPTLVKNADFTNDDLTRLVERLKRESKPFFIFPEFTILYGVLGAPSQQPLVWFHRGLTYSHDYDQGLDRWIVDSLIKQKVEYVVLQKSWFFKPGLCSLSHFPLLDDYIQEHFVADEQIGSFAILRQKNETEAALDPAHDPSSPITPSPRSFEDSAAKTREVD